MNSVLRLLTVFEFEWRRILTLPRLAWWAGLSLFPPGLFALSRANAPENLPASAENAVVFMLFALCPGVVSVMGTYLLAAPALATELEGRSWVYLAVRPWGGVNVLMGKYLVAVTWALPAGLVSLLLSLLVLDIERFGHLWRVQAALIVLSCAAYAAVFILLGVLFTRRAMVIGVFYMLVFEVVLSSVPAVVNRLTIQFRLRCLLMRWMDWRWEDFQRMPAFESYFGETSVAWHLSMLGATIAGLLLVAAILIRTCEFTARAEVEA